MKRIGGTFLSPGADIVICCGFLPHWVHVWNIEDGGTLYTDLYWNILFGCGTACPEGLYTCNTPTVHGLCPAGYGIKQYDPEEEGTAYPLTAASTTFLRLYNNDIRGTTARKWVLGSSANRTGGFFATDGSTGASLDSTYMTSGQPGGIIKVRQSADGKVRTGRIQAITTYGGGANYVTLDKAIKSGDLLYASPDVNFKGMATGETPKKGFKLDSSTAGMNDASGELHVFEAGTFEFTSP